MQYDLTNLQKKNERRLPAVAKSFLYESKRNFWSYTMKFQIRHTLYVCVEITYYFLVYTCVTILKKQVTSKWRWKIDVDAGLVFILNIDTRSQFPEKRKVVQGEKRSW